MMNQTDSSMGYCEVKLVSLIATANGNPPERLVRKAEREFERRASDAGRARVLARARDELRLLHREFRDAYLELDREGAIDEPAPYHDRLAAFERALARLDLLEYSVMRDETAPIEDPKALADARQGTVSAEPQLVPEYFDVPGLAAYLGISVSTIYHRSLAGELPTRRVGSRLLFSREEIQAWLSATAKGRKPAA